MKIELIDSKAKKNSQQEDLLIEKSLLWRSFVLATQGRKGQFFGPKEYRGILRRL